MYFYDYYINRFVLIETLSIWMWCIIVDVMDSDDEHVCIHMSIKYIQENNTPMFNEWIFDFHCTTCTFSIQGPYNVSRHLEIL